MSDFYYRSPYLPFDPDTLPRAKKVCEVVKAILDAGPQGADLKELSLAVHGPGREGTTNVYLSYDLPRKGIQAARLSNGRVTIVPTGDYDLEQLHAIVSQNEGIATMTKNPSTASLEAFKEAWLEEIVQDNPTTLELSRRFTQKLLRDLYDIDQDSSEVVFCDGAGDGGIDAAVCQASDPSEGVAGTTWIVVQAKYGTANPLSSTLVDEGRKTIETLSSDSGRLSSLPYEVAGRIREFLENHGPRDHLIYLLCTNDPLDQQQIQALNDIKVVGNNRLGSCFDVQHACIQTVFHRTIEDSVIGPHLNIELNTRIASTDHILLIGATKLRDIYSFMAEYKKKTGDLDLLYEKNVRKFLGNRRKVNRAIEKTLEEAPERFGLYNNGITLVVEDCEQAHDGSCVLKNPYVVNGCQTTRSIWSVLHRKLAAGGSNPTRERLEWERKLDQSVVVTKIVVTGDLGEELLTETTRYTNSQNAVSAKDFLSLEKDFRAWSRQFAEKYKTFLEIQRGAWDAQRALQNQNPLGREKFEHSANAFELLKAYAAGWLEQPGIAYGKNPPFAPGGSLFHAITSDEGFGVDALYASYLVVTLAARYGFGRGANKATRGQTKFLFIYLLISLIRRSLINAQLESTNASIVGAVIALSDYGRLQEIGEVAIEVVDEYLTDGNEDTLYLEPGFLKLKDMNAFLKSERFCRDDSYSPRLRDSLLLASKQLRKQLTIEDLRGIIKR